MSVFQSINVELDIEKLRKREDLIKRYQEAYGDVFVGIVWDDPDDPFCCEGSAMIKSEWPRVNYPVDIIWYGPADDRSY